MSTSKSPPGAATPRNMGVTAAGAKIKPRPKTMNIRALRPRITERAVMVVSL